MRLTLDYLHKQVALPLLGDDQVKIMYMRGLLRQMDLSIVKAKLTKSLNRLSAEHRSFAILSSRTLLPEEKQRLMAASFTQVYILATSHYPGLIQEIEHDVYHRARLYPNLYHWLGPKTGTITDIETRYYLFALANS